MCTDRNKDKKRKKFVIKRGIKMSAVLEKKYADLQKRLNEITAKADTLKTENGMIELDHNNEQHREWHLKDKYRGK